MSDPNNPDNPDTKTDDAVPSTVQDSTGELHIYRNPGLPEQRVSLGSKSDGQRVADIVIGTKNDIPRMADTDTIGTPLDLKKALEDLRGAFGGNDVIETEAIISERAGITKIIIEFDSSDVRILWEGTPENICGKQKFVVHPLQPDDPDRETVFKHLLELGMVRAILRHKLKKLSENKE